MSRLFMGVVLALLCATGQAAAQDRRENWRLCANKDREPPEVPIRACSAIIAAGQESDVDLASAFYNRGIAHDDKRMYDQAIADYTEAIRLDASDPSHFYNRGNSHSNKRDFARAIADYDQTIKMKPDHVNAWGNRGNQWQRQGQFDKALADYSGALRIDPQHVNSLSSRCWTHVRLDRLAAASKTLHRAAPWSILLPAAT